MTNRPDGQFIATAAGTKDGTSQQMNDEVSLACLNELWQGKSSYTSRHARNTMNNTSFRPTNQLNAAHRHTHAGVRIAVIAAAAFLVGVGTGAFWLYRGAKTAPTPSAAPEEPRHLSDATMTVLQGLSAPVALRYYSILDPDTVPDTLREYARRVDEMLSLYQSQSNGRLTVTRYHSQSNNAARSAVADGISAFNLDKGDGCFLGIAVASQDQKESLPHLSSEWEPALESDLTRAIMKVSAAKRPAAFQRKESKTDPALIAEVQRLVPNFANLSKEEGARVLQQEALTEFAATTVEMEVKVKTAQDKVIEAQKGNSPTEQQEAIRQLKQVQAEQADKLKKITSRLQDQLAVLEDLKKK